MVILYQGEELSKLKELYNPIKDELNREKYLGTYSSYIGSPLEKGKFQFDLWDYNVTDIRHNWSKLREEISKYGVRNSLLLAPMPTASTSQILVIMNVLNQLWQIYILERVLRLMQYGFK